MNITPETIYWITRLDGILEFLKFAIFALVTLSIIFIIITVVRLVDEDANLPVLPKSYLAIVLSLLTFASVANALIPTTKEMCAIIAIPAIANSETVNGLGKDIVGLAKEWIVELKPNKTEGKAK